MPTVNSSPEHEELHLLSRAVEGDMFHFVVVQWNYFSQIESTRSFLRAQFRKRKVVSIKCRGNTYEKIMRKINSLDQGFVFVEDFDHLLSNPDLYAGFNQRRGMLARRPVTVVAFLPPMDSILQLCEKNLPDWWSVLTLRTTLEYTDTSRYPIGDFPFCLSSINIWPDTRTRYRADRMISKLKDSSVVLSGSLKGELLARLSEALLSGGFFKEGEAFFQEYLAGIYAGNELYLKIQIYLARFKHQLGKYKEEAELLEEAMKSAGHQLNIIESLAHAYAEMGEFAVLDKLIDKSTLERAVTHNFDLERLMRVKALSLIRRGRFSEALELINNRLQLFEWLFREGTGLNNRWLLLQGECYLQTGQYEKALLIYSRITGRQPGAEVSENQYYSEYISEANRKCAQVWFEWGDFQRAVEILREERMNFSSRFGKNHVLMTTMGAFLGLAYLQLGYLEKAEKLFSEAMQSDIASFGEAHPAVATDLLNLGVVSLQSGEKKRAAGFLSSATSLFGKVLGRSHPKTSNAKLWLEKVSSSG
jgi:tetratricopeptide (TPR) repeat protein